MVESEQVLRGVVGGAVVAVGGAVAAAVGYALFVVVPGAVDADHRLAVLVGVALATLVGVGGLRVAGSVVESLVAPYDVGEVAVEGPITRDGGGTLPTNPQGTSADEVVDQIERADDDDQVEALLLRLNTPGGQVVPSEDIRLAAERFDGPTVAYATDTCASGGYWIASGCDELWAREGSVVGSIGVVGSQVNAKGLADRVGLSYEQLTAGEYKDAGARLKEFTDDDREYLQDRVDDYYEQFVETVVEGRGLDSETVRETEARVYLGREADDMGLVDELGTREDVKTAVAERIGVDEATVREFEPERGLGERLRGGAATLAYAFGAGVASVVDTDGVSFEVRH